MHEAKTHQQASQDKPVGSHILVYGIHDLETTFCSTLYATLGIQASTLMFLLICMTIIQGRASRGKR